MKKNKTKPEGQKWEENRCVSSSNLAFNLAIPLPGVGPHRAGLSDQAARDPRVRGPL